MTQLHRRLQGLPTSPLPSPGIALVPRTSKMTTIPGKLGSANRTGPREGDDLQAHMGALGQKEEAVGEEWLSSRLLRQRGELARAPGWPLCHAGPPC